MTQKEAPELCETCHLPLGDDIHDSYADCIQALRSAMLRQKEAAQGLAFEVSIQFLAVLEELSLHPDVGVAYRVLTEGPDHKPLVLPPERVAGVFAAIHKKFRELGDWSPLKQVRTEASTYAYAVGKLTAKLQEIVDRDKAVADQGVRLQRDVRDEITELLKAVASGSLTERGLPRS